MKMIVSMILTALLAFTGGLFLPWWVIAAAGFTVAVCIYQPPLVSFLSGFLGILGLWVLLCLKINDANEGLLASKMASILPFGGSVFALIAVTSLVGALVGGLGALTGSLLRKINR